MIALMLQMICLIAGLLTLLIPSPPPQEVPVPSRGRLKLLPSGHTYTLDRDFLTIGRSRKRCDLYIRDPDSIISRQHADLVYQPDANTYRIVPVSKKGGVSINQLPVEPQGQLLRSGDRISLCGQFELIYEQEVGK